MKQSLHIRPSLLALAFAGMMAGQQAHAIEMIAMGSLSGSADLSGLTDTLENGVDAGNVLGGIGSGLAWAGGNTFLALPDRGPNAAPWNSALSDTTSYIARYQTVTMNLTANAPGSALAYNLTPTLSQTTLLYSPTALNYAAANSANNFIAGAPALNTADKFYFTGRSDNFAAGNSLNPANARFDTEGIRVSNDGKSVFIADEYGPYVYQFDRATGERLKSFALPDYYAAPNLYANGDAEIAGNSVGRVTNKGMEGLAITPDGTKLVGFVQAPLAQDGGSTNRIVTIDIADGTTHEYVYDNTIAGKTYNSSELLALNDHEFLVLERDGKGLGDGSAAKIKQIYKIDLSGATDIGVLTNPGTSDPISGAANLLPYAVSKTLFLDLKTALNAQGIADADVPSKLEGMAFGEDILVDGVMKHTLWITNDNDFLPSTSGANNFYVFAFGDEDLGGSVFLNQNIAAVPEPESYALMLAGLGLVGFAARRKRG